MKIEEIYEFWDVDCKIDRTELGSEATKIPQLHNKYFKVYSKERLIIKQLQEKRKQLKLLKFEYYSGSLDQETLEEKGWIPNRKKIIRSDLDMYIEADQDMVDINLRIAMQQEKLDLLESIIKSLNSRGFELSSAIKWEQFRNGG